MNIDGAALAESLRALATSGQGDDGIVAALEQVLDACVGLFGVDGAGILIADEQNVLRYVAATDGPGRLLEQTEAEAGQGPCTEAFVSGTVITSTDVTAEADRWPVLASAMATATRARGAGHAGPCRRRDGGDARRLPRARARVGRERGRGTRPLRRGHRDDHDRRRAGPHGGRARPPAAVRPRLPRGDRARGRLPDGQGATSTRWRRSTRCAPPRAAGAPRSARSPSTSWTAAPSRPDAHGASWSWRAWRRHLAGTSYA